jgi:hypothetical protein
VYPSLEVIRVLKIEAVAVTGEMLFGRESENPRPGSEGMTTWKAWLASSEGVVRGWMRWERERLVRGKGGKTNKGRALGEEERAWMKWILRGDSESGRAIEVRNWGMVVLRSDSTLRKLYFSSLGVVSMGISCDSNYQKPTSSQSKAQ